jgi:hypothetical protein
MLTFFHGLILFWSEIIMLVILATSEDEIGKILVQGQHGQIVHKTPISKITGAKWIGVVAQSVECLLCKCELRKKNYPQSNLVVGSFPVTTHLF